MRELGLVMGLVLVLATLALVDPNWLMDVGRQMMLGAIAIAIPFEIAYFAGLSRQADLPRGWYWRSYEHHGRLHRGARSWVLGCFAIGSVSMLVAVLGIVAVFVAAWRIEI